MGLGGRGLEREAKGTPFGFYPGFLSSSTELSGKWLTAVLKLWEVSLL